MVVRFMKKMLQNRGHHPQVVCKDLEEYDRNLNHCKNCRRRQNTTDFDDTREERQVSHSQSFGG